MGLYDETVKVGRRTMVLFFIIDTSGSMRGAKTVSYTHLTLPTIYSV